MVSMKDDMAQPPAQSPFERLGGQVAVRALVDHFYDLMQSDPAYARLRAIHAEDLAPMRQSLTGFLNGWMGGPRDWFGQGKCVMSAHSSILIDGDLREQWLSAMNSALDSEVPDAALRSELANGFARVAHAMTNG